MKGGLILQNNSIQPLLVSRLFLNLKEAGREGTGMMRDESAIFVDGGLEMAFASGPVLGNIGAPLDTGERDAAIDEDVLAPDADANSAAENSSGQVAQSAA